MTSTFKLTKTNNKTTLKKAYSLIKFMYPEMEQQEYETLLNDMLKSNKKFILASHRNKHIALCTYWIDSRFHSGKYIQIDSLIIDPKFRNKKLGTKFLNYIEAIGKKAKCSFYVLDIYTDNNKALKLYSLNEFKIKGYHLMKEL